MRGGCVWGKKLEMRTVSGGVVGWKGKGEEGKGLRRGALCVVPKEPSSRLARRTENFPTGRGLPRFGFFEREGVVPCCRLRWGRRKSQGAGDRGSLPTAVGKQKNGKKILLYGVVGDEKK